MEVKSKVADGLFADPHNTILIIVAVIAACSVGVVIGWYARKLKILEKDISAIKLDTFFFYISILALLFSFVAQGLGVLSNLSGVVLNIFTTMIFSWLLTKSSSKAEFKEQEEQLAKRSYRHMSGIASETKRSIEVLRGVLESTQDEVQQSTLKNTLNQLIYIHSGISLCNEDWYDLLSADDQTKADNAKDEPSQMVVTEPTCGVGSQSGAQDRDYA